MNLHTDEEQQRNQDAFEAWFYKNQQEIEARAERLDDRIYRESVPNKKPNEWHATTMAVITGRSEDGTMYFCKGGMWSSDIEGASILRYGIAARYVRMRSVCQRFKQGEWTSRMYQVRVRRVGIEIQT